jgi:CHASE1-domain containing sensor protein
MSQDWNPGESLAMVENAEIDPRKFEEYSMNPNNPANQGKWMAFAVLGYDVESDQSRKAAAQNLINQLRQGLVNAPATQGQNSIYGIRFQVQVRIFGVNGRVRKSHDYMAD